MGPMKNRIENLNTWKRAKAATATCMDKPGEASGLSNPKGHAMRRFGTRWQLCTLCSCYSQRISVLILGVHGKFNICTPLYINNRTNHASTDIIISLLPSRNCCDVGQDWPSQIRAHFLGETVPTPNRSWVSNPSLVLPQPSEAQYWRHLISRFHPPLKRGVYETICLLHCNIPMPHTVSGTQ